MRELAIQEWKKRSRVRRDATKGRNGGAGRTGWEALLEVEKYNNSVEELDQGAITLVADLTSI